MTREQKLERALRAMIDWANSNGAGDGYPGTQAVAALSTPKVEAVPSVADIVPDGCTSVNLVFAEGVLCVNKDGSGYIAVDEEHWDLEDDRCEGPDGPEGSVHWITKFPPGEMEVLRNFLNGAPISRAPTITDEAVERIEEYYSRQIEWSRETFGPALRTGGVIDHIRKELKEIEADPHDLSEWVDVIILAMDGFWRHGGTATDLMPRLLAKQRKNMARAWPDWRTMSEDRAIEHDRSGEADDEAVERAAKHITKWMGFSWKGLLDGRVTDKGFPVFTHGQFGRGFQGRKGDMLDLARTALLAAFPSRGETE